MPEKLASLIFKSVLLPKPKPYARKPKLLILTVQLEGIWKVDKDIVVEYMHAVAYRVYYVKGPGTQCLESQSTSNIEVKLLGLDAGSIWDQYPNCVPRSQDLDLRACPTDVPGHSMM